ncbi:hypothetical protein PF010_g2562 [Phytophthora fragariae]|uniref:Uncharacterized protein n=2 Tax=Phytophthora fragariae TaxID=53985 RepID=A0A6A3MDC9_9STRA|nr:hypothetical protein PF011_g1883 [Phytophthora fragariae]KAE9134139.1 hypothetical protein PF010_g2562 [Phytophthora fragariae]KAE9252671.1 hypothetical protein PF004_g1868 [Phytophthora fragariae]
MSALKMPANDAEEAKKTLASEKLVNGAEVTEKASASKKQTTGEETERKPPASKKLATGAEAVKKTSISRKTAAKTKKFPASSKPAPKKDTAKKPAAKQLCKKKDATKETSSTLKRLPKRKEVLLPGPYTGRLSSSSSDTDTPSPGLITGDEPSATNDLQTPRAPTSETTPAVHANSAATPPQARSPSPDPSLQVDHDESGSDNDHEAGEVEDLSASPQLTDEQRVLHAGSPMTPKSAVAVARARSLEQSLSRRDADPPAVHKP